MDNIKLLFLGLKWNELDANKKEGSLTYLRVEQKNAVLLACRKKVKIPANQLPLSLIKW